MTITKHLQFWRGHKIWTIRQNGKIVKLFGTNIQTESEGGKPK